ncbi:MAG: helix-turn-helix domain-containing protein [Nanoarchaeota archaeon]|nr:hypothetical protein [Nanoarchaeota archaeon]MBU1445384.1 hypothetical protein [Nanoarchaeota archaeon]MBU2406750.1 hypothetical protein [Nanoarchaeota archaeon]MBU2420157.1 hypothetical protein [Nanoarchaeota archaeon]MBU2475268.1 hypothetical protein [Nanoarchaeota archaeon]
MYENLLEEAGLTKNEVLTYLALLKLGKAKSGEIVRQAKISGGKIYETLYKLVDKGLVKVVYENNIKHFIANDPKMILNYLQDNKKHLEKQEKELEKILPHLEELKKHATKPENVSLVKGFKGIATVVYEALEQGKEIKIMGIRSSKDEKFNNFWKKWHKRRLQLKKKAFILFSDKNTPYWEYFKKIKYTEVREITTFSPSAVMIINNNSFIFSYEEEFTCIHIVSEQTAKSFESFFDSLWIFAKPQQKPYKSKPLRKKGGDQ